MAARDLPLPSSRSSALLSFCLCYFLVPSHGATPTISNGSASSITSSSATVTGSLSSFDGADQPSVILYYDTDQNYSSQRSDPFIPLNFGSSLAFWLDANESSSIIQSSGSVTEWRDRSGNGLHLTQTTGSKQPITGSVTQNGLNVISFDGDDYLARGSSNFQDVDQTWIFVAEVDAGGVANSGDGIISYGGYGNGWHLRANNAGAFRGKIYKVGGGIGTQFINSSLTGYQMYTIGFDRGNTAYTSWRNGTVKDNGITDTKVISTNQTIRVFSGTNTNNCPIGKMAEVICITSVSTSDRQRVEGYLAHKWGLNSALAGTHPYSVSPPTSNLPLGQIDLGTQAVGNYSQNLNNLSMGTTYRYRFLAKNSGGSVFSSIDSFTTVGLGTLISTFPDNITPTSATLKATILSNGQEDPTVTFYWGDNNGSSTPGNWDSIQILSGTHGVGTLTHSISGLTGGTTYFFTAMAQNSAGAAWAPVTSFLANSNVPPNDIQSNGALNMFENTAIGTAIHNFSATDSDAGATITFSLSDLNASTQNSLFSMEGNGTLRNAVSFNYENNASSYLIRVRATDEFSAFREEEFTINLLNVNEGPLITSYGGTSFKTFNRLERNKLVTTVTASDPDSTVSYSINGGSDQALFEVNASSGVLSFIQVPDFEVQLDSNSGNDYNVTVRASDGTFHADQNFVIDLINTEDPPEINLLGVSSVSATTAVLDANMSVFTGANQPQVILFYDDNSSFNSGRVDPHIPYNLNAKLSFWLDANDSSTITHAAGAVSQWTDKSGNYHSLTQDDTASKPTTGAASQNGLNVISFDGGDLLKRNYSNILEYDQTWFIVARVDTGGIDNNGDSLISYGGGLDGRWELRANNASNFTSKIAKNGSWLQGTETKTITLDQYHIFTISFDTISSTISNWVDGELRTNALSDPIGLAEMQKITLMGNRQNTPQTLGGKVAEVICMRSVDPSERLKLEGYLAHKWDINGTLYAGHPHIASAPTLNQPLSSVALGAKPLGAFSHTLTGLAAATTYQYRFQGVYGLGQAFSSTGSFTTTSLAQVRGIFPTNTTPTSATLRSEVLSTGGEDVGITFYWGDDNASNTAGNWDHNYSLGGTHGLGTQTHPITGLSAGVTYYFTSTAVNTAGTSWAPVMSFLATSNAPPDDIIPGGPLNIQENIPSGSVVVDFNATDPDAGSTLTYSLFDQNSTTQNHFFTLDANGTLRTATTFDYETNASSYVIRIRATDQFSSFREEMFTISLTDINESPYLTSFNGVASHLVLLFENTSEVGVISASDHEPGNLAYSLSGGADQALFEVNASTGSLRFTNPPDFENAMDTDTNNIYLVSIQASDGTNAVFQDLNVSIVNTNEAPILLMRPTTSITGTSAVLEGNLTTYTGATQPTVFLQYDSESNYTQSRPFLTYPNSIGPQLAFWLDANDTTTLTHVDGNVSQWRDKSGNNQNLSQDTNASKPATGQTTQNGNNVVSFDGTDYLQRNYSNILNSGLSCYIVAAIDTGGISNAGDSIISYGYGGDGRWELRAGNTNNFNSKVGKNSTWLSTANRTVSFDNFHLFTLNFDSNGSTFSSWVNGEIQNDALSDPFVLADKQKITLMGNRANPTQTLGGKVAEVIFVRNTENTVRLRMEGYLAHKWGINASLQSSHPYRFSLPGGQVPKQSVNLGSKAVGVFTHTLTGLTPGTQYRFRYQVGNPNGIKQTAVSTFTTIGLPSISSLAASLVTMNASTLSATLSATGGADANMTFFWGNDDAGNVAANWDNNYTFSGLQGVGSLSRAIANLAIGTQHYFKVRAVNLAGTTWSQVYSFSTSSNQAPNTLSSLSTLTVVENQSIGTIVGEFNATDSDPNATFTYLLVSGAGDGGNANFSLESNGTLRTATVFDFETNATTQSIRVQVKDQYNATFEVVFNVTITDDGLHDGAAAVYTVSSGQFGSPYYTFVDANGQTPNFDSLTLLRGSTYMFVNGGVSGSHPFMIGESFGDQSSTHVFGGPLNSGNIGSKITMVIPSGFSGTLLYYCTAHSSMQKNFLTGDPITNSSPTNLVSLGSLSIPENQSIGTVVAEFNATDSDSGDSLSYNFVSGSGDGNNSLFTLETNGTLKTAAIFDYENNSSTFSIRLEAKDDYNASVEGNFTITLTNVNETPVITQGDGPLSYSLLEGSAFSLDLNATDIENDPLSWTVSVPASNGTASLASGTGILTYSPNANYNGTDSVTVTVSDGNLTDSVEVGLTITGVNDAPVITQGDGPLSYSLNEDSNLTVDLNATDVDGNALTWSVSASPSNGTASIDSATGVLSYTPDADFDANDTLTVSVTDGIATDTVVVNYSVTGVNDAPVITQGDGPLSLSILEDASISYDLNVSDPDSGDSASWSLSVSSLNGTGSIASGTGILTYSPNADFNGSDSLTVLVTDGAGVTDSVVVNLSITAVNDAPVITQGDGPLSYSLNEDSNLTIDLNATDIEGDVLTWSVSADPSNGTASIDSATGVLLYTPHADFDANDTLTVTVTDGTATDSVVVNFTVTGVNDAPTSISSTSSIVFSESAVVTSVIAEFTTIDPDTGDFHVFTLFDDNQSTDNSFFSIESNGTLRTAVLFDFESNSTSYQIRVRATDSSGAFIDSLFSLALTDANDPPQISSINGSLTLTTQEDQTLTYTLIASDQDTGDTLTWSMVTPPTQGTASLGSSTGQLEYLPHSNFHGVDSLVVSVIDSSGSTDVVNLALTISSVNDSPVFSNSPGPLELIGLEDSNLTYELNATDPDMADSLTWSVLTAPVHGTGVIDPLTGLFSYLPSLDFYGSDSLVVSIVDPAGANDLITLNLTISGVNDSPVIAGSTGTLPLSLQEDTVLTYDFNGSDVDPADSLTWSISVPPAHGTASIDPGTGVMLYNPKADYNGTDSLSILLSDGSLNDTRLLSLSILGVNDSPASIFLSDDLNFSENLPLGSSIGILNALDPDPGDSITLSLPQSVENSADSFFSIDSNGTLRTAALFDFESNSTQFQVVVRATDLAGEFIEQTFDLSLLNVVEDIDGDGIEDAFDPDVDGDGYTNEQEIAYGSDPLDPLSMLNRAPVLSGTTAFVVDENNENAVFQMNASDLDQEDVLTFRISGSDEDKFVVNVVTGQISFLQPPDFEANGSAAGNNLYSLILEVSDGEDNASSPLTIEVADVYEPPPNDPPTDLVLSNDRIEENLPAGQIIGVFSTLDPDDPGGTGTYQYELLPLNSQSVGGSLFSVDLNGTLYTAAVLDFETSPVHQIRVRTTDQYAASFEKSLSISVIDSFHPIVQTGQAENISMTQATLGGQILDQGGTNGVFLSGILVSLLPEPILGAPEVLDFPAIENSGTYSIPATGLVAGEIYYFRAYAQNPEGISYGFSDRFETSVSLQAANWASANPVADAPNWWNSSWWGAFYQSDDSGWIRHSSLGWVFVMPNPQGGIWFWMKARGWLWTDAGLYPFLFDNLSNSWVYFYGGDQQRVLLYNYQLSLWIEVAKEEAISQ